MTHVTTSLAEAAEIMGSNFFFTVPVCEALDLKLSDADAEHAVTVPFSPETLKETRETHLLLPYIPISIAQMVGSEFVMMVLHDSETESEFVHCFRERIVGCNHFPFYHQKPPRLRWHLISKKPDDFGKVGILPPGAESFRPLRKLIGARDEIPLARTLCFTAMVLHHVAGQKVGVDLGNNYWCRDAVKSKKVVQFAKRGNAGYEVAVIPKKNAQPGLLTERMRD